MKLPGSIIICFFLGSVASGQTIVLHPDTADRYVIVNRNDSDEDFCRLLIGYKAFCNSKKYPLEDKARLMQKFDSVIQHHDTVYLTYGDLPDGWSKYVNNDLKTYYCEADIIEDLVNSGDVMVYDAVHRKYVSSIKKRKRRWRATGCFRGHGKEWVYKAGGKEIISLPFNDGKTKTIRARF